jgi:ribosomal protein S4
MIIDMIKVLTKSGFASSNNEAKRLLREGAVEIDGKKVSQRYVPMGESQGE